MEKKSAPAYLGLQGWLISESSQSIHLTLPQNCQKGNFSSSERGELTIKTDPYKNSHLKSISFFSLFLSQKTPRKSVFDQNDKKWSYFGTELILFRREVGIIIFLNEQWSHEWRIWQCLLLIRWKLTFLKAVLHTNVLNDITAAPFSVGFFTTGSWEKDTKNGSAVTLLRTFLRNSAFIYAGIGDWVGLRKSKARWRNTWMVP